MSQKSEEAFSDYVIRRRGRRPLEVGGAVLADVQARRRERVTAARLTADDALRNRIAVLAESPSVAYAVTDSYGGILEANEGTAKLLAIPIASLPGKRLRNYLVRESRQRFYAAMARVRDGHAVNDLRVVLRPLKGGPLVEMELSALGKRNASGALVAVHWFLRAPSVPGPAPTVTAPTTIPMPVSRVTSAPKLPVVVVEDDEDFRDVLSIYLSDLGCDVLQASDGIDALACMYASVPRLVLVDMRMPRMSGVELIEQIRTDRNFADVSVVAMSSIPGLLEQARASGADLLLPKPFDPSVLAPHLRSDRPREASA